MSIDVIMPQLGETVAEGKIIAWFKAVGDAVKPGDNLFEVETDKVTVDVPVTSAGIISDIRFAAGDVAKVGAVVAVISEAGAPLVARAPTPQAAKPTAAAATPPTTPTPAPITRAPQPPLARDPFDMVHTPTRNYGPATRPNGAKITPLARRLAHDAGIDLAAVTGSGPHGRITARDIATAQPAAATAGLSFDQIKSLYRDTPHTEIPVDGVRRAVAARLVQAKQTVPHLYLVMDLDLEKLNALRDAANAAAPRDRDFDPVFKISVNDFVIKALALALQRVPAANAVWADDRILQLEQSDIAVVVGGEGGLPNPVIRRAESKSLSIISIEMKDLAARARARKLMPQEYQGGSSTVSNLGMHSVREFSAIINPPHATMLAVGAAQRRPVETADGGVKFTSQMTATLSCDHRVVDGALGAQLLAAFKALIENPMTMLV